MTGAGSGIGRATALEFARGGLKVAVVGRRPEALAETVALVEAECGEALAIQADVSCEEDVRRMVEHAIDRFGRLDAAANCAALPPGGGILELSTTDFDRAMATNLRGVWLSTKFEAKAMIGAGAGAIVNVSSVSAVSGGPSDYSASKAGVEGLTRGAAGELASYGIRVNALRAGLFDTPMLHEAWNTGDDPETALAPAANAAMLKRIGDPAEAAAAIIWLCSPAASFVTGTCMAVDGGILARWV